MLQAKKAWRWFITTKLGCFLVKHFEPRRVALSLFVAGVGFVFGTLMLVIEVSEYEKDPVWARLYNFPLVTALNFALNYRFTWGDRKRDWRHSIWKWFGASVVHATISWWANAYLIDRVGLHYLLVTCMLLVTLGPIFFVVSNVKIFRRLTSQQAAVA